MTFLGTRWLPRRWVLGRSFATRTRLRCTGGFFAKFALLDRMTCSIVTAASTVRSTDSYDLYVEQQV